MTTKLLIVALCILAGTMAGLVFSKRLNKRAEYYEGIIELINLVISEVKFRKSTTKDIMADYIKRGNSQLLCKHLGEYILCSDIKNLILSPSVISKTETEEIQKLLCSFGTADSETQIFELENYKQKFSLIARTAVDKRKTNSGMYIKLGFLAGLALGIILL